MWSEILKIKPTLDNADLNKMVSTLSTRFNDVAKKFSKGLGNGIKGAGNSLRNLILGGGVFGLAGGLINKMLNPLKETQDTLEKMLSNADDLSTNAGRFDTTAGRLFKLQSIAQSAGVKPEDFTMAMGRFHTAIAQARLDQLDPKKTPEEKQGPLSAFLGEKDTAEAFFQFIQALQKESPDKRALIQEQVFGQKLIGKLADFVQLDFPKQIQLLRARTAEEYDAAIENPASLKDRLDAEITALQMEDMIKKSKLVNDGSVDALIADQRKTLNRENRNLAQFEGLKAAQMSMDKLSEKLEEVLVKFVVRIPDIMAVFEELGTTAKSFLGVGEITPGVGPGPWAPKESNPVMDFFGIESTGNVRGGLRDIVIELRKLNSSRAVRQPGGKK